MGELKIKAVFQTADLADKLSKEVREVGILDVYKRFYEYYRPILAERFDIGSETTPYEPSSLGRKKRSGEIIKQVPLSKFNKDTMALYNSVTQNVKITDDGMEIRTDVPYAEWALSKFKRKGDLAPEGLFYVDNFDLDVLDTILIEEYEEAFSD